MGKTADEVNSAIVRRHGAGTDIPQPLLVVLAQEAGLLAPARCSGGLCEALGRTAGTPVKRLIRT